MNPDSLKAQIARIVDPLGFELSDALETAKGELHQLRAIAGALRDSRLSTANSKAEAILALPDLAALQAENTRLKALVELAGEVVEPFAAFFGDLFDADAPDGMVFWTRAGTGATITAGHSRAASALRHQIRESGK